VALCYLVILVVLNFGQVLIFRPGVTFLRRQLVMRGQ